LLTLKGWKSGFRPLVFSSPKCPGGTAKAEKRNATGGCAVIVRILNEGQYRLDGEHLTRLGELDQRLTEAVAGSNDIHFRQALDEMLNTVRQGGMRLPKNVLAESELVLPAPDATLAEVQQLFTV